MALNTPSVSQKLWWLNGDVPRRYTTPLVINYPKTLTETVAPETVAPKKTLTETVAPKKALKKKVGLKKRRFAPKKTMCDADYAKELNKHVNMSKRLSGKHVDYTDCDQVNAWFEDDYNVSHLYAGVIRPDTMTKKSFHVCFDDDGHVWECRWDTPNKSNLVIAINQIL
jgi:hypothetical protein